MPNLARPLLPLATRTLGLNNNQRATVTVVRPARGRLVEWDLTFEAANHLKASELATGAPE
jgi:hypothetical protein